MMVSTDRWRSTICVSFSNNVNSSHFLSMMLYYFVKGANNVILAFLYISTFLLGHGDIERNPGANRLKPNYLSICHWNLNSISAHNLSKKITKLNPFIIITLFVCLRHT